MQSEAIEQIEEEVGLEAPDGTHGLALIVFSGEFDRVIAAFTLATDAAGLDLPVTMFFTYWGLEVLLKEHPVPGSPHKTLSERLFGRLMPKGPEHLALSHGNLGGLGSRIMRGEIARKHLPQLSELMAQAQSLGVQFVADGSSMNLLGVRREELVPEATVGGVATFLAKADMRRISLFI